MSAVEARPVPAVDELVALGRARGLAAVGVTTAEPFPSTRHDLEERRSRGLHGGMAFTYRNPARSTEPGRALPGARALVVGAWPYVHPPDDPDDPGDPGDRDGSGEPAPASGAGPAGRVGAKPGRGPRGRSPRGVVARYARTDHYAELRGALDAVAGRLRSAGWRARVLADDNALVDRAAARRAGLGWYGKNANLLLPGQGSWFVLGSVVTDAPLPESPAHGDGRPLPDGCGSCTRCLDGCPTGAIVAPGVVDARRCLAWLLQVDGPFPREHRAALGDRIYGCDDCQEVCPPNRRATRRPASGDRPEQGDRAEGEGEAHVDLLEMLQLTDDELLARFGRWYVPRRQPRYLRRNALVVLGNVADPGDPGVEAALRRCLRDGDPVVRSHAVWAARRMGRADLVAPLAAGPGPGPGSRPDHEPDPDPLVREELAAEVEVRRA